MVRTSMGKSMNSWRSKQFCLLSTVAQIPKYGIQTANTEQDSEDLQVAAILYALLEYNSWSTPLNHRQCR